MHGHLNVKYVTSIWDLENFWHVVFVLESVDICSKRHPSDFSFDFID